MEEENYLMKKKYNNINSLVFGFLECTLLVLIISESIGLINNLKVNSLIDYTQGDLSIMFSVHVPLAIFVTLSIIPLTIYLLISYALKYNFKAINTLTYYLMILSIIALVSGILWGVPIWGKIYIIDKKIFDIFLIISIYSIITFSNKNKILFIFITGCIYYFIKVSMPDDISSLHQNFNNKSNFLNSIPGSYLDMVINNVVITFSLCILCALF